MARIVARIEIDAEAVFDVEGAEDAVMDYLPRYSRVEIIEDECDFDEEEVEDEEGEE